MAVNLDIIGKKKEAPPFIYNERDVIPYALAIGAGVEELDFVYEKNLKVFPTFAVIPTLTIVTTLLTEANINLPALLYAEQKIILHRPIPPSCTLYSAYVCPAIYDKGDAGAFVYLDVETRDKNGHLLFENKAVGVDRSAGNFGGERGPKAERFDPPEGKAPDFRVEYETSPNQHALYRLTGDTNPLHIDPEFAKLGGFDRPILHGLCTFGFTGRAILHTVCKSDPTRLKSFSVRFMNVVFPGETLITESWKADHGKYIIQTKTQNGRLVLGNGITEVV